MLTPVTALRALLSRATLVVVAAAAPLAHAAVVVSIDGPPGVQHLSAPAVGQPGFVDTITLTLNQEGNLAFGAQLNSLGFSGANAADFAIVPGGTCVPGSTFLYPITSTTGSTCTVKVHYTPTTAAVETAQLTASCDTLGVPGGFSITCTNTVGTVASLVGSLLTAVPALSPATLTALALSLFALGAFTALRGPRAQSR